MTGPRDGAAPGADVLTGAAAHNAGARCDTVTGDRRRVVVEIAAKGLRVNLDNAQWRRSDHGDGAGNRVEVAFVDGAIAVRGSADPDGPVLLFTQAEWDAFVEGAKDGEFDL